MKNYYEDGVVLITFQKVCFVYKADREVYFFDDYPYTFEYSRQHHFETFMEQYREWLANGRRKGYSEED